VAEFLNNGGGKKWTNTNSRKGRIEDRTFNSENVAPLMQKVINKSLADGSTIQDVAKKFTKSAITIRKIYNDERGNRNREIEEVMAEEGEEGEEGIEAVDERRVNIVWDKNKKRFLAMDVYKSFHDVFKSVQFNAELMMHMRDEKHLRKQDAGTGTFLIPTDVMGNPLLERVPVGLKNIPKNNMKSEDLEKAFINQPPDVQANSRIKWGDEEMYRAFTETFGPTLMKGIDLRDFEYQEKSGEVNEEIIDQESEGEEDEDLEGNLPDVEIPPEAEDLVEEVDEEADEGIEEEYQAQYAHDPFADMDDDEDEFDFGDDDDDFGPEASTDAIKNLIKLSQELDNEGKVAESIELLRLAKKFSRKLRRG
jgi:hypothetical protein